MERAQDMNVERRETKAPSILLPLDGSPESHVAIPVAKTLAGLTDTALHIVHVARRRLDAEGIGRKLGLTDEDLLGTVLDAATGPPAQGIVRTARERRSLLIVMAMHDGHPQPETGLGSVAAQVLDDAPCPLVLVPPGRVGDTWTMGTVLLPQNSTPETAAATEPLASLAYRAGAELLVLYVSETAAPSPAEPGSLPIPRYLDQPQHEWPVWSGEFVDRIRALCHLPAGFGLRFLVAQGEPGTEILRVAEKRVADLIALPWHESLHMDRAATLKAVMRGAPCPVLVLPFSRTPPLAALGGA
jgi:nucleotide-binding universal stress UspA family protein